MVNDESTADAAAKVEILTDTGEYVDLTLNGIDPFFRTGEYVDLTLNGIDPFFRILKTISKGDVSFTLDEECVIHYATEDDERFVIAQKGDRVLVIEMDWDENINAIRVLEVDPDNYDESKLQ
jgi:hypothetical protein